MLGHDDVAELPQVGHFLIGNDVDAVIHVRNPLFSLHDVKTECTDLFRFNSFDQRVEVGKRSPGTVDEDNALFHLPDTVTVDEVSGRFDKRHMDRDDIALAVQFVKRDVLSDLTDFRPLVGIVGEQAAAKACQVAQDSLADPAGTDYADGKAAHLAADQTE